MSKPRLSLAAVVQAMADAGCTPQQIAAVVATAPHLATEGHAHARWTRSRALLVVCPRCFSPPGEACEGKQGPRWSMHRERHCVASGPQQ